MAKQKRWSDPANDGQVDLQKIGARIGFLIMVLMLATALRMAIVNHWFDNFFQLLG